MIEDPTRGEISVKLRRRLLACESENFFLYHHPRFRRGGEFHLKYD